MDVKLTTKANELHGRINVKKYIVCITPAATQYTRMKKSEERNNELSMISKPGNSAEFAAVDSHSRMPKSQLMMMMIWALGRHSN